MARLWVWIPNLNVLATKFLSTSYGRHCRRRCALKFILDRKIIVATVVAASAHIRRISLLFNISLSFLLSFTVSSITFSPRLHPDLTVSFQLRTLYLRSDFDLSNILETSVYSLPLFSSALLCLWVVTNAATPAKLYQLNKCGLQCTALGSICFFGGDGRRLPLF